MKTSTLLKSLSAVGILGTAIFSTTSFAAPGDPNDVGAMHNVCSHPNYMGDPSRCGGGSYSAYPVINVVVDKSTDKAYALTNSSAYLTSLKNETLQMCQAEGGDCQQVGVTSSCIIVYKRPESLSYGKRVGQDLVKLPFTILGSMVGIQKPIRKTGFYDVINKPTIDKADDEYDKYVKKGEASKQIYRNCVS